MEQAWNCMSSQETNGQTYTGNLEQRRKIQETSVHTKKPSTKQAAKKLGEANNLYDTFYEEGRHRIRPLKADWTISGRAYKSQTMAERIPP